MSRAKTVKLTGEQLAFLRKVDAGAKRFASGRAPLKLTAPKLAALQAEANARAAKAKAVEAQRLANAKNVRKTAATAPSRGGFPSSTKQAP